MRDNSGTGLFDEAFSESVIDAFDFETPGDQWWRIEGGSSQLSDKMEKMITIDPTRNARVTSIALDRDAPQDLSSMVVQFQTPVESKVQRYATVFNTASLACQQRMDLKGAELHPVVKDALRCLHYDASTKVAIKF